ncbi:MAG: hypothetical protein ACRBBP_00670 [Bdellovibrionales bacterium]
MITDVPKGSDFYKLGVEYSMMAQDAILELYESLEGIDEEEEEGNSPSLHLENSPGKLKIALLLLHQGTDCFIKSRICEVSPYLLIQTNDLKSHKKSFEDYYSHDSSKLIEIHNTFTKFNLDDKFKGFHKELRTNRNKISHSLARYLRLETQQVLEDINFVQAIFLKNGFMDERNTYMANLPGLSSLESSPFTFENIVWMEFCILESFIKRSLLRKIYGFKKDGRKYYCPTCYTPDSPYDGKTAVLKDTDKLSCFLCKEENDIIREDCQSHDCSSNVLDGNGYCSLCGY